MRERPLRILAIGSSGSNHVANRVRCFAERGHVVSIITERVVGLQGVAELSPSAPPGQDRWLTRAGDVTGRLTGRNHRAATDMARLLLDYRRLVRQAQPDVVHVHYAYNTWAWMAAVLGLNPLVVSIMGGDVLFEEQGNPTPRGIALTKRLLGAADLITSKSHFLTGVLDKLGGYGKKAIRVVWGVDPDVFRPLDGASLRSELGIPADARVVLSPKILTPFYNVHVLVEAMAHVVAREPRAHLVVTEYGADPAYKAHLAARLLVLGLQHNVTFVGYIPHERMPQFYAIADISVGIPASDGLPQTLLEAMACGVANVVGPLDRYSEIVRHGDSAVFTEIEPRAVAAAILRLLCDEALRERLAQRGREVVVADANFPVEVERVEEAYYRLASRRRTLPLPQPAALKDVAMYWLDR